MPLIQAKMEQKLFEFLKDELKKMGCMVSIVNGMPDHVHCLELILKNQSRILSSAGFVVK